MAAVFDSLPSGSRTTMIRQDVHGTSAAPSVTERDCDEGRYLARDYLWMYTVLAVHIVENSECGKDARPRVPQRTGKSAAADANCRVDAESTKARHGGLAPGDLCDSTAR